MFYLHEFKSKYSFLSEDLYYIFISLLTLLIAIFLHEMGHYIASFYYGLNPIFGINFNAIYVETGFLSLKIHEIVSHAGPILNLIISFFVVTFLFIRGHTCSMKDHTSFILFSMIITNLLVALISLILFPFSEVL